MGPWLIFKLAIFVAIAAILLGVAFRRREALQTFFGEVHFELTKKVTWPSTDSVINLTVLVTVVTVILSLMTLMTDSVFAVLFKLVLPQS